MFEAEGSWDDDEYFVFGFFGAVEGGIGRCAGLNNIKVNFTQSQNTNDFYRYGL